MKVESCPYCGAVALCRDNKKYKRFRVVCLNVEDCDAGGPWRKTREEAIRAWNRLALAISIAEALEWRDECQGTARLVWDTWCPLAVFKSIEEMDANIKSANEELRRLLDQWEEESE